MPKWLKIDLEAISRTLSSNIFMELSIFLKGVFHWEAELDEKS